MRPPVVRVVERQALVFKRFWRGSLTFSFVSPLLFLAAMGFGLGGLVEERTPTVAGVSYLEFIAPGLLAAGAMQSAAAESLWSIMAGLKWIGSFQAMVTTPIGAADVYTGVLAWTGIRNALGAAAFLVIAAVLGAVPSAWAVLALPAAVLTALAFAAPIMAFSATQETDVRFPIIMRFGIVPLFLFSGTFFPVEDLPGALQPLAALSPLWHGVELCRAATTGSVEPVAAVLHAAVLTALVWAGWTWGVRTFPRRLTQ